MCVCMYVLYMIYKYMYEYVYTYLCMYVCVYVVVMCILCMYVCMCVCLCTYDVCMYHMMHPHIYCFSSQKSYEYLESNRESSEIDT
jgi:hypothetical protein